MTTRRGGTRATSPEGLPARSAIQWTAIWVRTVARSWRSGLRDLYSHLP